MPSLRVRQAAAESEFAQGLSMAETPAAGLIDWSVTFGDALTLIRRGQGRWPATPWIIFCRTDPDEVRARLLRTGLPGEPPTVVGDFAALVEAARNILAKAAASPGADVQAWRRKWDEVPFGVALVERRRRVIHYTNPVLNRWLGRKRTDLTDTSLGQLHPPEQVRQLEARLLAAESAGAPPPLIEVSFIHGGQIRFADALVAPAGPDGPDFRTIFYVDASARRAMEGKWRRLAEAIFQTSSGEAFFRTLVQGLCGVLEVDMAAVALLLPGEPAHARIVAMSDQGALVDGFEIAMAGNPCEQVLKHRFLCVTRRVARSYPAAEWLLSRGLESYLGLPLFDQAGRPIGILEVMHRQPLRKTRDLRAVMQVFAARAAAELERLCAETARRQTEAGLAHTQRLAHIGSWELDVTANRLAWSDETYRIHGMDRASFVPTVENCLELIHADDRSETRHVMQAALAGQGFSRFLHRIVRPDGVVRHLECEGEVVRDPSGRPLVLRGTLHDITDRVEAQAELQRLALVARETDNAVVLTDAERRVQWVNAGFTRLTGYEPADVLGRLPGTFLRRPGGDPAAEQQLIAALWQDKRSTLDIESHHKSGRRYWAHCNVEPLRDAAGRITGHFAIGSDITDRKLTEDARRLISTGLANRRGTDLFEQLARETALLLDADMCLLARFTGPDRRRAHTLGLWLDGATRPSMEYDLAGTPCGAVLDDKTVVHPAKVAAHFPADQFLAEQRMESYAGVSLFNSSAEVIGHIAILGRRPFDHSASLIRFILQMIASKAASEIERQDGERMFYDLFAQAPDATILVDRRGRIVMANQIALQMFGYTAGEMHDLSVENLMPESARSGHMALREGFHRHAVPRPMKAGRPNLLGLRKDGRVFPVDISLSPISTPEGPGVIAAIRDMTEQRLTEARLRQSQKLESLGQLAGGIAHDFNNILSGILGFTELTLLDLPPGHLLRDNLLKIQKAGLRARSLVAQILTVSRRSVPVLAPVQPAQVVREVLDLLRPTLPATVEIALAAEASCPLIMADPAQIHQVLMNLCTNAWQALPDGRGRITVELAAVEVDSGFATAHPELQPGAYVRFTVADNGCGMDAANLEHAFDPFFTTKAVGQGTGLGLAVVHGIVRAHHGAITVRSVLAEGTTFDVYLPAHAGTVPEATKVGSAPATPGAGQRILLVDDDEVTGPVLTEALRRLGYRPVHHRQPKSALAELVRDPASFDLILTDMTMPEMTGVALAAEARKYRPDLPVLLITGLANASTREAARRAGVREVLLKPVALAELGAALQRCLG